MFNIKTLLRQALLALALCGASLAAHADVLPASFRVTLNTAGITGGGFLDMTFNGFGGSAGAVATISNMQGAFTGHDLTSGAVANPAPGVFTIGDDADFFNYMWHSFGEGDSLSFDVSFSGDFLTVAGNMSSIFSVALFDATEALVGADEGSVVINVTQLGDAGPAMISVAR